MLRWWAICFSACFHWSQFFYHWLQWIPILNRNAQTWRKVHFPLDSYQAWKWKKSSGIPIYAYGPQPGADSQPRWSGWTPTYYARLERVFKSNVLHNKQHDLTPSAGLNSSCIFLACTNPQRCFDSNGFAPTRNSLMYFERNLQEHKASSLSYSD